MKHIMELARKIEPLSHWEGNINYGHPLMYQKCHNVNQTGNTYSALTLPVFDYHFFWLILNSTFTRPNYNWSDWCSKNPSGWNSRKLHRSRQRGGRKYQFYFTDFKCRRQTQMQLSENSDNACSVIMTRNFALIMTITIMYSAAPVLLWYRMEFEKIDNEVSSSGY